MLLAKQTTYTAQSMKIPDALLAQLKAPGGIRSLAEKQLGALPDAKITGEKAIKQGAYPGTELTIEANVPPIGKITSVGRVFIIGDQVIQLSVGGPGSVPAEAQVFFDSLQIGAAPPKSGPTPPKADPTPPAKASPQPTGAVPTGWVSFKSPAANYTVAMPQQPVEAPTKTPTGEMKIFQCKLANGTGLATMVVPVPAEVATVGPDVFFQQMAFSIALGAGGKVTAETKITLGANPGREFQFTPKAQGAAPLVCCRAYLVGNSCIILMGPGAAGAPTAETVAFFNSLKLGN
jgi:hypothetical protein